MHRLEVVQKWELSRYHWALYNVMYGLANHELKHYSTTEINLARMRELIKDADEQDFSISLFKVLRDE